jgi:hypothetical protein
MKLICTKPNSAEYIFLCLVDISSFLSFISAKPSTEGEGLFITKKTAIIDITNL